MTFRQADCVTIPGPPQLTPVETGRDESESEQDRYCMANDPRAVEAADDVKEQGPKELFHTSSQSHEGTDCDVQHPRQLASLGSSSDPPLGKARHHLPSGSQNGPAVAILSRNAILPHRSNHSLGSGRLGGSQ